MNQIKSGPSWLNLLKGRSGDTDASSSLFNLLKGRSGDNDASSLFNLLKSHT